VLPLVCKRWARIMKTSTVVWHPACLDMGDIIGQRRGGQHPGVCSANVAVMTTWFHARPGRFVELGLRSSLRSLKLPSVLSAMLLSTQAASLRELSLDVTACGLCGHELEILAAIYGLTALDVRVSERGLNDRGAAMFRAASSLTALQQLEVGYAPDPAQGKPVPQRKVSLPRCCELSKLRSQSLRTLTLAMSCGPKDLHVLRLAGVANLKQCHLLGDSRESALFRIDATSFTSSAALEQLTLHHQWGMSWGPGCFDALSALTSLTLTECALTEVPSVIASLTALRILDLSQNVFLEVDDADAEMLFGLKLLRSLDLAKPKRSSDDTRVHTALSMQAVFDMVEDCHGEGRLLHVNFDPDLSATYQAETAYFGAIM